MYKELRHKVMVWLLFITIVITIYASFSIHPEIWKMWFILPLSIFMIYLTGKWRKNLANINKVAYRSEVLGASRIGLWLIAMEPFIANFLPNQIS